MATYQLTILGRQVDVEVPDPEQTAVDDFTQQVQEGWGNDQALEDARIAGEVRAMDMNAYSSFRKRNGIGAPDLADFLGGTT